MARRWPRQRSRLGHDPFQPAFSSRHYAVPMGTPERRHRARILLVDDEQAVQTLLTYPLRKDGYEVVSAQDGREALDRFAEQRFDLVVLDIMMPRLDGIEVCRRLRARSQVPIIMLTAKDDEIDKVLGLEMGADDYITKPFSVREFRSRVRAALRRSEMRRRRPPGPRRADRHRRPADRLRAPRRWRSGTTRSGSPTSSSRSSRRSRSHPGRVMTRENLLEHVWGDSAYRDPRTIDVHIRHLREKLEAGPALTRVPVHRPGRGVPLPRPGVTTPPDERPLQAAGAVLRDHDGGRGLRLPLRGAPARLAG